MVKSSGLINEAPLVYVKVLFHRPLLIMLYRGLTWQINGTRHGLSKAITFAGHQSLCIPVLCICMHTSR